MASLLAYFASFNTIAAIVFIAGFLLMIVEMSLPGFGIAGVMSITAFIIGIILQAKTLLEASILLLVILAVLGLLFIFIARSFVKGRISKSRLILSTKKPAETETKVHAGDLGVALSDLRPAGIAQIGAQRIDVLTRGEFLQKGDVLRVLEAEHYRVIVAKHHAESE
ncbi:MAG: NfeD family protein [Christensenellales bacterium]